MTNKIIATTTENLQKIIQLEIKINGYNCDLNHIDVSKITDMNCMFWNSQFNGDISNWDVSNVTYMSGMFCNSQFNGEISNWNVSNVTDMYVMFYKSKFNGDLTKWLPYSLAFDKNVFKDCTASRPYWANFDNLNNMKTQIDSYLLYSELNSKLHIKENSSKKHKI